MSVTYTINCPTCGIVDAENVGASLSRLMYTGTCPKCKGEFMWRRVDMYSSKFEYEGATFSKQPKAVVTIEVLPEPIVVGEDSAVSKVDPRALGGGV